MASQLRISPQYFSCPFHVREENQLRLITLYNILHGNLSVPSHSVTSKHLPYATRLINKHQLVVPYYRTNSLRMPSFLCHLTLEQPFLWHKKSDLLGNVQKPPDAAPKLVFCFCCSCCRFSFILYCLLSLINCYTTLCSNYTSLLVVEPQGLY